MADVSTYATRLCCPLSGSLAANPMRFEAVSQGEIEGLYRRFRALDRGHKVRRATTDGQVCS